ncbi:DUF4097 family beta strand repeat-containing protein [Alkalihalobacillus sp. BA299]|uniref:DUF4097 family beta strand repeat-containing protein n=1 Tax=Alkalihalobacillus sp. BA299 TaxID=2815938 RepID=UPI001ADB53A4|nr:DUF4097 family beta strand repeat-containing protein [Alkalihalobacillus sp. BA299]
MKKIGILVVVFISLFLAGCNLKMVQVDQEITLNASELQSVMMDLDEGEVEIIGETRDDIKVIATFASRSEEEELAQEFQEENMTILLDQKGDQAHLITNIDRDNQSTIEARIHIKAFIPKHLEVVINHDGGNLRLSDLSSSLILNQGAGKMSVENFEGNLSITDGTGALEILNTLGNITINNNSGAVHIENNTGDVKLISGTGKINIERITGMVQIRSGSGSIYVDQIEGDVTILENRSGSVEITNVSGEIKQ